MEQGRRWQRSAPWAVFVLFVVVAAADLWTWRLGVVAGIPESKRDPAGLLLVFVPTLLVVGATGAFIASRRSRNPIGWVLLAAGASMMTKGFTDAYVVYGHYVRHGHVPGFTAIAWFSNWSWIPGMGLAASFFFLLFPTGRLPSPRWRPVAWLGAAGITGAILNVALAPGPLEEFPYVRNPIGLKGPLNGVADALGIGFALIILCAAAGVVSIVVRARRGGPVERAQIKWIAFAGAFFVIGFGYATVAQSGGSQFGAGDAFAVFGPLSCVAIATAIAIQRYRLFDIDRIVSRTVSYALLSGLVIGAYALMVVALDPLVGRYTRSSGATVAFSTLVAAALFGRLHKRVQALVDHRFNRTRYDAQHTLDAFASQLRLETDLGALSEELCAVASRTMRPAHVGIWLAEREKA